MFRYVGRQAYTYAFIGFSIVVMGCGRDPYSSDAVPSNAAVSDDSKMFGVVMVVAGSSMCSGTVVSRVAVLTAGHCLENSSGRIIVYTKFGSRQYSTYSKLLPRGGTYDVDATDDFGIVHFSKDSDFARDSEPYVYRLAGRGTVKVGDKLIAAGYGCTNIFSRENSGALRETTVSVVEIDNFIVTAVKSQGGARRRIATGGEARGIGAGFTCNGDSGGFVGFQVDGKYLVVGATHAGGYYGDRDSRSGVTIVSEFVDLVSDTEQGSYARDVLSTWDAQYDLEMGLSG